MGAATTTTYNSHHRRAILPAATPSVTGIERYHLVILAVKRRHKSVDWRGSVTGGSGLLCVCDASHAQLGEKAALITRRRRWSVKQPSPTQNNN